MDGNCAVDGAPLAPPTPQESLVLAKKARAEAAAYFQTLDARQQLGLELQVGQFQDLLHRVAAPTAGAAAEGACELLRLRL